MNILNKLIAGFLILCSGCAAMAQTVKQIEVAGDEPYVDHVALVPGSTDMDLLVKIAFNEPENSLTVSLISYRRLFVFQSDVRYSHVVRWHKLKPEKLLLPCCIRCSGTVISLPLGKGTVRRQPNSLRGLFTVPETVKPAFTESSRHRS